MTKRTALWLLGLVDLLVLGGLVLAVDAMAQIGAGLREAADMVTVDIRLFLVFPLVLLIALHGCAVYDHRRKAAGRRRTADLCAVVFVAAVLIVPPVLRWRTYAEIDDAGYTRCDEMLSARDRLFEAAWVRDPALCLPFHAR